MMLINVQQLLVLQSNNNVGIRIVGKHIKVL